MSVYLDANATTPLEPTVRDLVIRFLTEEIGNAGSRTHEFGQRAKQAVQHARDQIARVVQADPDEVIFTSGATESNNLALLGIATHGEKVGKRHIISTAIEHKAVLEPLEWLQDRGFEITLLSPEPGGYVSPTAVQDALRSDTLLVSVMHANNETGVRQPIAEIAEVLGDHEAYFHVDAAQGYGKRLNDLQLSRIDLIAVSSHKIYGPLGIGALITRKRGFKRPPLSPLMRGGGQERGLRPGTLPTPLIAGFGLAAELAFQHHESRRKHCERLRREALEALEPLGIQIHGDPGRTMPHVLNFSVPGLDSEAVMVTLKGLAAVSNGSACTSASYTPSHVLEAMALDEDAIRGALRFSWSHLNEVVDWQEIASCIRRLM